LVLVQPAIRADAHGDPDAEAPSATCNTRVGAQGSGGGENDDDRSHGVRLAEGSGDAIAFDIPSLERHRVPPP
jgi:hypothetical protein